MTHPTIKTDEEILFELLGRHAFELAKLRLQLAAALAAAKAKEEPK